MTAHCKLTFAAAVLAVMTTPALAENPTDDTVVTGDRADAISINVYYSDLNLASEKGVGRLETRVRSAARSICITGGIKPVSTIMLESRCFKEAVAGAEPQIADAVRNYGTSVAMRASAIAVSRRGG